MLGLTITKRRCPKCNRTIFVPGDDLCGVCSAPKPKPAHLDGIRIGRNEPCPCGSGKKFKNCHLPIANQAGCVLLHNPEHQKESP